MKHMNKNKKSFSIIALMCVIGYIFLVNFEEKIPLKIKEINTHKKALVVNGVKYDGPEKFAYYQSAIRAGQENLNAPLKYPQYKNFSKNIELKKARQNRNNARIEATSATFIERGPANVPGRTRTVIVDPDDTSGATWFAGNVSGGIWKTTNSGAKWTEIAPNLDNMAIVTLAMSAANTSVIYAGTGEGFVYNGTFMLNGEGIYKSTNKGVTWTLLPSTVSSDFINVSRIIVDPTNENILLASTSGHKAIGGGFEGVSAIMRSTDGGINWTKVYENTSPIQQIIAAPSNFDIQYASIVGIGVVKSTDSGLTWSNASTGMSLSGRIELSVSYSNVNKVYGSALGSLSGTGSDLYLTEDGGNSWGLVTVEHNGTKVDFLGGQGWYDNTIMVNPFDDDQVYFGGVGLFSITRNSANDGTSSAYDVNTDNIDFIDFVNFGAAAAGGILEVNSSANEISVEVRFGSGVNQKAHRFKVPDGQGSGVPDGDYSYQDYVQVPFEVWDVTNNIQLMASFRDQQNDGEFNLIAQNTSGDASTHSREYLYVSNVAYDATNPDVNIATNGGHLHNSMYFLWPVLAPGTTWDANNLATSKFVIFLETVNSFGADLSIVADVYSDFDGINSSVHPDQHFLTPIITNQASSEFKIVLGNDGGIYLSDTGTDPGKTDGSWTWAGADYNTTQFYGADKIAGSEVYLGGAQDNGTWISLTSENASSTSQYDHKIGGDGFEVIAHYTDPNKYIGGSQFNGFVGFDSQGAYSARSGLPAGEGPFVSRLSNAYQDPDVIFAVQQTGVFRSTNFGRNWKPSTMNDTGWGFWSGIDVEVSKADPRIVWAGGRMTGDGNLFVSQDGGISFDAVPNFADIGLCTGIYSHPTNASTAFAVFSVADSPKILKTIDLGQTWIDISGYSANSTSTGFPNVATFALQAMPYDDNVLWAGTEIGLFESLDGGATWNIMTGFPSVTIWDLKIRDGQIVIATHGRGIWTADIAELVGFTAPSVTLAPVIKQIGTSLTSMQVNMQVDLRSIYDNAEVFANGVMVANIAGNSTTGIQDVSIDFTTADVYVMQVVAYKGGVSYYTEEISVDVSTPITPVSSYFADFDNVGMGDFTLDRWTIDTPTGFSTDMLSTEHPYPAADDLGLNSLNLIAKLNIPITVASGNAIIKFNEVVQVEEGEAGSSFGQSAYYDYVVVEGSTDGVNYTPLLDGYDSDDNSSWSGTSNNASSSLFVERTINILNTYAPGEIIKIRFRLYSDFGASAWGWGIDDLKIQIADNDADGFDSIDDCDDNNAAIYPGAVEIPNNNIDEDCDGTDKLVASNDDSSFDKGLELYPNPVNNYLYITIPKEMESMNVYTTKGVEVRNVQIYENGIDVSQLKVGVYIVIIKTEKGIIRDKFIKE